MLTLIFHTFFEFEAREDYYIIMSTPLVYPVVSVRSPAIRFTLTHSFILVFCLSVPSWNYQALFSDVLMTFNSRVSKPLI